DLLLAGFAAASARLEAVAPAGPPLFIFVATGPDATLLFPREERVLAHGPSDAVLEALAGVRIDPSTLRETLTGCPMSESWANGLAIGDNWRAASGENGAKLYLKRDSPAVPWHVATLLYPGEGLQWSWRADYSDFRGGLPHSIHLVSADRGRFDLSLMIASIEPGALLGPD